MRLKHRGHWAQYQKEIHGVNPATGRATGCTLTLWQLPRTGQGAAEVCPVERHSVRFPPCLKFTVSQFSKHFLPQLTSSLAAESTFQP